MRLVRIMCLAALMFTPARDSRAQTGQVSADPAGARSQREQLTSRITERWGNYIQEVYKSSVEQWAWAMQTSFARASIATLQRAARARTFTEMNDELLRGDGPENLTAQQAFFDAWLGPVATALREAVETAVASRFYCSAAGVLSAFAALEGEAFGIAGC